VGGSFVSAIAVASPRHVASIRGSRAATWSTRSIVPDGSSALVLAIEHLWAIPLRDAVRDAGGIVLGHRSLTPED
jgi:hypothetical protein